MSNIFRPQKLNDIIGQVNTVKRLQISIDAAKKENRALGHTLFFGQSGCGKTLLSSVLASEMGVSLTVANAPNINSVKELLPYVVNQTERSILFIDEIHRCNKKVQEILFPVLEDFKLDMISRGQCISMDLPKFTIIGSTTEEFLLLKTLKMRFIHHEYLTPYTINEMCELITINAEKVGLNIDKASIKMVAERCRKTPRIANSLIQWLKDYSIAKNISNINVSITEKALEIKGIDERGMNHQDKTYIDFLKKQGCPTGVETLSAATNIPVNTIKEFIEPYLLDLGMITKTSKGRILNDKKT